jgi:hypothetical protein
MHTQEYEYEDNGEIILFDISYMWVGGRPANFGGHPDTWAPPESPELEILEVEPNAEFSPSYAKLWHSLTHLARQVSDPKEKDLILAPINEIRRIVEDHFLSAKMCA